MVRSGIFGHIRPIGHMSAVDSIKGFFAPSAEGPGGAVHRRINKRAVWRLRQQGYIAEADWFSARLGDLAGGSAWADGRLRNLRHFYHPSQSRGLFHLPDAEDLAERYLSCTRGEPDAARSAFYLGAALHLVQDLTIPQHAGLKLLDGHHAYETFVRYAYLGNVPAPAREELKAHSLSDAIRDNAWQAFMVGRSFARRPQADRFQAYYSRLLPLAEKSTAECMLWFYRQFIEKE